MKKIFLLIVLFAVMSFGQNRRLGGEFPTDQNYSKVSVLYTYDATDSTYHAVPGISFTMPSGYTGDFTHFGITDTLYGYNAANGAKDTLVFDLNGMAKSITVGTKDTGTIGSSAGLIDSLSVDVYIPLLDSWTTLTNGLFRLYDGQYTSGDVVVPGNGYYKEYYIVGEYIDQIRVRWNYPLSPAKTDRKVPITIYGSN